QLAPDEPLLALELAQHRLDLGAEAPGGLRRRERPAPPGVAHDECAERVRAALEKRVREPTRRHRAERVAVTTGILGRGDRVAPADLQADRPSLAEERGGERGLVFAVEPVAAQAAH